MACSLPEGPGVSDKVCKSLKVSIGTLFLGGPTYGLGEGSVVAVSVGGADWVAVASCVAVAVGAAVVAVLVGVAVASRVAVAVGVLLGVAVASSVAVAVAVLVAVAVPVAVAVLVDVAVAVGVNVGRKVGVTNWSGVGGSVALGVGVPAVLVGTAVNVPGSKTGVAVLEGVGETTTGRVGGKSVTGVSGAITKSTTPAR